MRVQLKVDLQPFASHANSPRLCKRYCNALLLAGEQGPRCPHCAHCEWLLALFGRDRSVVPFVEKG